MIFKYTEFLAENHDTKPSKSSFFVLVSVAIFNPEIFSFLGKAGNRYTMTASEVNQLVLLEVRNHKNIIFRETKDNPREVITNLESNWFMIKKANESAQQIRNTFHDITKVYVAANELEVETSHSVNSIRRKQITKPVGKTVTSLLGIDEQEIYRTEPWGNFVTRWVEMLHENLVSEASNIIDKITNHRTSTWNTYISRRKDTLGVKVPTLPRLYYNNLLDFSKDIVHNHELFIDYDHFMESWLSIKRKFLVNELLAPMLKSKLSTSKANGNLSKLFNEVTAELNGVSTNTYFTLNAKGNLIKIEPNMVSTEDHEISYKLLTNKKSELIINITNSVKTIKILVGTSLLSPSHLKISVKQNG